MEQKKLSKLALGICLILVLTAASLVAACSEPSPTPAASPAAPSAPEPAASPTQVIELKFSHHMSPSSDSAKVYQEWANKLKEQTQGKVEVTIFPGASLVSLKDAYKATIGGICDIAFISNTNEAEQLGLNLVVSQPAVGIPTFENGNRVWDALWDKFPELRAELAEVKVLTRRMGPPEMVISTAKKQVRLPSDIKGMKLIANGAIFTDFVQKAGASPISQTPPDFYMSLERGLAEGLMSPYMHVDGLDLYKFVPYHLALDLGATGMMEIMNLNKWNSLPPDVQKAITDLSPWMTQRHTDITRDRANKAIEKCLSLGHTIIENTPEEKDAWKGVANPIAEKWISENEAKGKPARAVFEEAIRLSK